MLGSDSEMRKKINRGAYLKIFVSLALLASIGRLSFTELPRSETLPTNPLLGSRVFIDKGCVKCHAVWGEGESFGPDLTQIGKEKDFFELAGALWSHSPKMIEVMEEKEIERPVFSPKEAEELMAYVYYLGIFDELGDYLKGEEIFSNKGCRSCHSLGKVSKNQRLSLDKYGGYISPVFIAAALWNHSSSIGPAMAQQSFAPQEMSHLLAYIRGNALNESGEISYILPGNPNKGQAVFKKKKCTVCHGDHRSDLSRSQLRQSLTEIVRMMWNHSNIMWEEMKAVGLKIPHFDDTEMADLMAYLYFMQFYQEDRNLKRGEDIFTEKGCGACHSQDAVKTGKGIDLADVAKLNIFELVSAMWNHAPEMEKMVTEFNLVWPRFEKDEMRDLVRYIQSLK